MFVAKTDHFEKQEANLAQFCAVGWIMNPHPDSKIPLFPGICKCYFTW